MNKTKLKKPIRKLGFSFINTIIVSIVCAGALSCSSTRVSDGPRTDGNGNSIRYVTLKMIFDLTAEKHVDNFFLQVLMPQTIKKVQVIKSTTYSLQPDSIGFVGSNQYAYFHVPGFDKKFKLEADLELALYQQSEISPDSAKLSKQALAKYLAAEKYIESNSPEIKAVADTLRQESDVETITKTYFFVHNRLSYNYDWDIKTTDTTGAKGALKQGVGRCQDFSDLFVALVRANGIPAKSVMGVFVDHTRENPWHAWSEVYVPDNGWVIFDPTFRHNFVNDGVRFVRVSHMNSYIIFSDTRRDSRTRKALQWYYSYFPWLNNKVKVKDNYQMITH